jgi:hypothetical protein
MASKYAFDTLQSKNPRPNSEFMADSSYAHLH